MGYYIIIRGPAGVGKTTIAKAVAGRLKGHYISIDHILKQNGLDVVEGKWITERNFIKANELALKDAVRMLDRGTMVVLDGNFYHKGQLEHLKMNLPYRHMVFTLKADVHECIKRDKERPDGIGEEAIKAVFILVDCFDAGTAIQTKGKTADQIGKEIVSKLPDLSV